MAEENDYLQVWQDFHQDHLTQIRVENGKRKMYYSGLEVKSIIAIRVAGLEDNKTISRIPVTLESEVRPGYARYEFHLEDNSKQQLGSNSFVKRDKERLHDRFWESDETNCEHD